MDIGFKLNQATGNLENARQRYEAALHDLESNERAISFAKHQMGLREEEDSVWRWWADELKMHEGNTPGIRDQVRRAKMAYEDAHKEVREVKKAFREFVLED